MFFYIKKHFVFFFILCFISFNLNSQILSGNNKAKIKKNKPITIKKDSSDIYLFLEYSPGISFRKLYKNESFINKPFGIKDNEKPILTHSFSFGMEQLISSRTYLKIALSSVNFGEQYKQKHSDSSFLYKNHYRYIGIPLNIGFKSKKRVSFAFSTGLEALFLIQYLNKSIIEIYGNKQSFKIKQDKNRNSMQLAVNADIKLNFPISKHLFSYLDLAFTKQLTNSYNKQGDFKHFSCLFNLRCGIMIPL